MVVLEVSWALDCVDAWWLHVAAGVLAALAQSDFHFSRPRPRWNPSDRGVWIYCIECNLAGLNRTGRMSAKSIGWGWRLTLRRRFLHVKQPGLGKTIEPVYLRCDSGGLEQ